jgi:hypothetical protein
MDKSKSAQGIAGTVRIIYSFAAAEQQQCFLDYDKKFFASEYAAILFALEPIRAVKFYPLAEQLIKGLVKISFCIMPENHKDFDGLKAELPGWFLACNGKIFFENGCAEYLKTV